MSHRRLGCRDLWFGYSGTDAVLRGADVEVRPGARTALLGSNGCGKTTLLRCLAGALRPQRGTVELDGVPVERSRAGLRAHRRHVQLVLQDPDDQLFAATVRQDVSYGPANLGLPAAEVRERVDTALTLLSLQPLADRPIHQLSHGQRKRVAVAGAVAMQPCVLLLDEPTAGLDPAGTDEMLRTLEVLERRGTTVLMSTHDVDLALRWADDVAVVAGGRVVQQPATTALRDRDLLARCRLRPPQLLSVVEALAPALDLPAGAHVRDVPSLVRLVEGVTAPATTPEAMT